MTLIEWALNPNPILWKIVEFDDILSCLHWTIIIKKVFLEQKKSKVIDNFSCLCWLIKMFTVVQWH